MQHLNSSVTVALFADSGVESFAGCSLSADIAQPSGHGIAEVLSTALLQEHVEGDVEGKALVVIGLPIDNIMTIGEGVPEGKSHPAAKVPSHLSAHPDVAR